VLLVEHSGERSAAQIAAFEDTWHGGIESEQAYQQVITCGPIKVGDLLQAFRTFHGTPFGPSCGARGGSLS